MAFDREKFVQLLTRRLDLLSTPLSIRVFASLSSTNQKLWELLQTEKFKEPVVIIAEQQTAGKGQWGRQWQSSLGGLYLSLAWTPSICLSNSYLLTFCSAWGIATNLRHYNIPVFLKWPNDLILSGRKLGGILTETHIQQEKITQAIIGVGLNWSNFVPQPGINLQSFLQQHSLTEVDCLEMLAALTIEGIFSGFQCYSHVGLEEFLALYLEILSSKGRCVRVDDLTGTIVGVTSDGQLRIRLHSPGAATEIYRSPGTISIGYD